MGKRRMWRHVGIVLAMFVTACSSTAHMNQGEARPTDPVLGLLSRGITQLDVNITTLSKRMNEAQQAAPGTDPKLRELQALDLSGWELHRQQWVLQRNHLILARDLLQQASSNSGEKGRLLNEWRRHQEEYSQAIGELRLQRKTLEEKHVEVEARLIEHGLQ